MLASSLNDDELISILNGLGSMSTQRSSGGAAKTATEGAEAVAAAPAASIAAPSTSKAFLDALKSDKRLVSIRSLDNDDDDDDDYHEHNHNSNHVTKITNFSSTNTNKGTNCTTRSTSIHNRSSVSESLDMSEDGVGLEDGLRPRGGRIAPRPSTSRSVSYVDMPKQKQTKKALPKSVTSNKLATTVSSSSVKTKKRGAKSSKSKGASVVKAAEKAYSRGLVQQGVPLIPKVVPANASRSRLYEPAPSEEEDGFDEDRHYGVPTVDGQLNDSSNYADGGVRLDSLESDTRLKTLRLRLSGGQLTIKVLESQLNEAALALTEKQSQLDNANRRIRLLEKGAAAPKPRVIDHKQSIQETARQEMCRVKKNVEELSLRLDEETQRRQHADARAKMLKEHIEKVKAHCVDVDCKNTELSKAVGEVEVRIGKYRRENKELSAEAAGLKIALVESERDREQQRVRAERADVSLRSTVGEVERLREELRLVRIDNHIAQEKIANGSIELNTAREAEAMLRTELKYKDSRRPPVQPRIGNATSAATATNNINNNENTNPSNINTSTRGGYVYDDVRASKESSFSDSPLLRVSFDAKDARPPVAAYQKLYGNTSGGRAASGSSDEAQHRLKERKSRLVSQAIDAQSRSYDSDYLHGKASAALPVSTAGRQSADLAAPHSTSSFVRDRVIRSASPSPAKPRVEASEAGGVRLKYERLQKMYEKVTGRDAKLGWKNDSDSDMD